MSSPRHRGDGRGEVGDMLIQIVENDEEDEICETETNQKGPKIRPPMRSSLVRPVRAAKKTTFGNKNEC